MDKPKNCCDCGTYEHCIPMPIKGRLVSVDFCLARIVGALNAANIRTDASCCGHGKMVPTIMLEDGRVIEVLDKLSLRKL